MSKGIKLMNAIGKAMDEGSKSKAGNGSLSKPSKTQERDEALKDTSQDFHMESDKGKPANKVKKA